MNVAPLELRDRLLKRFLRLAAAAAPDWVRDWSGPFTITRRPGNQRDAG